MMARRSRKSKSRTASFDGVGKGFAANQEYEVKVKECSVEDGDSAPYYAMKLEGVGEFEGSLLYHNASLAPAALWRTREVFEAFLGEVPDGDFDVDEYAEMFVGKSAMCNTFKSEYNGKTTIKPEDFWPLEGGSSSDDGEGGDEVELDDLDDDDIKKLGKELGIKSKRASTIRKELEDIDEDDLVEAMQKLGLIEEEVEEGGEEGEEGDGIDLDDLDDADIQKLAKAAGIKVTKRTKVDDLREKLGELDSDELEEAAEEAGIELEGGEGGGGDKVTADEINEMDQEELEAFVEENELDVDLDDFKTLRKKRSAVVDAAEEADLLSDD